MKPTKASFHAPLGALHGTIVPLHTAKAVLHEDEALTDEAAYFIPL